MSEQYIDANVQQLGLRVDFTAFSKANPTKPAQFSL